MELLAASDVAAAGIAAGGAIIGVLAGGFITYELERRREKTQREREEEAERRATQGIARVCSKKLGDFYVLVDDHSPPRAGSSWWKAENDVDPQIDIEDMKRVAAIATREQWCPIDYALTHVRDARAARDSALSQHQIVLSDTDVKILRRAMKRVEGAIESLAELSRDQYPPEWLGPRIEKSKEPDGWRFPSQSISAREVAE